MILELADIRIQPGQQAAFDEAIERGLRTVIANAKSAATSAGRSWTIQCVAPGTRVNVMSGT